LTILDYHYSGGNWGATDKDGNPVAIWQRYVGNIAALIEDGKS
jgi:hypothetical protein